MEILAGDPRCVPHSFVLPESKKCISATTKKTGIGFKVFDTLEVSINLTFYSPFSTSIPVIELDMGWDSWITLQLEIKNVPVSFFDHFFPVKSIVSKMELARGFELVTLQFKLHIPALFFQLFGKSNKPQVNLFICKFMPTLRTIKRQTNKT